MIKKQEETKNNILKALKSKREIVINKCWGGFGLSMKAVKRYAELKGFKIYFYKRTNFDLGGKEEYERVDEENEKKIKGLNIFYYYTKDFGKKTNKLDDKYFFSVYNLKRDDEILVRVVKELGKEVNGEHSELKIVTIPSHIKWNISDYDGMESVEEEHRSWS